MVAISSLQQLRVLSDLESVPANVRHYETLGGVESPDHAWYHTKAAYGAVLLTGVEEQLEAEADAEEGSVLADVLAERVRHAAAVQDVHGGAEGADAGEDEAIGGEDVLRAPHVADAEAEVADGVAHAAHVPRAVVQQRHRVGVRGRAHGEGGGAAALDAPLRAAAGGAGDGVDGGAGGHCSLRLRRRHSPPSPLSNHP
uniref:AT-HF n=1 Tax=Arundo donax TaxID=35708 RepID=A0A0A9GBS5_ARUDO